MRGGCPRARRTSPLQVGPLADQGLDLRLKLVDLLPVLRLDLLVALLCLLRVDRLVAELLVRPLDGLAVRGLDRAQMAQLLVDLLQRRRSPHPSLRARPDPQ